MADKEYRDLAPISDIEDGKEYLEALNWALDNPKIKNIALTGPYGAGKSSIIDTFLKQNSKKQNNICKKSLFRKNMAEKSIKISMATFAQAGDLDSDEKIHIEADEVEEGILKQLFYKVEHKKIPQSRYRKLHVENFKTSLFKVIALTTMMVILGDILKPEVIGDIWKKITEFTEKYYLPEISSYIILGIYVIAFVVTISHIWSSISTRYHVKEITLPAEAKVEKDNNLSESVFNKNLDEIMYFFEATGYRIVFFEDLDRLDDRKIFVHLRELNNLLNNDDTIKEKPIVFIYAVKDDIFTKDDRTKFFDFIIPVIPVINSTNSGEILLKRLQESEKNGIQHNISSDFIFDVSPYISDMRVLQNIYNEFVIYKNLLSVHQALALRDEQMMAMIIFKNLYPKDFADIQNETGVIKKAFENKNRYIKVKIDSLQNELNFISDSLKKADEDHLKTVQELKVAMLTGITGNRGIAILFYGGNGSNNISAEKILEKSFDMRKFAEQDFHYIRYTDFRGASSQVSIGDFKEKIRLYVDRWEYLNILENQGKENLNRKFDGIKQKFHFLESKKIADLIENETDFEFDEGVSKNKLLVFLLRRGYIDENYANCINYFKGNSITTADMNFILSVKNREPKSFDYSLTATRLVAKRLQLYEFEQKAIYNFSLMEQLLSNDDEVEKRKIFIEQLSDESDESWQFIDEFMERTKFKEKFIVLLSDAWIEIWKYISTLPVIQYERQLYYLNLFFLTLNIEKIKEMNVDDCLKNYLEEHEDLLSKVSKSVSADILCEVIKNLNVSFGKIQIKEVPNQILDYIFDGQFYDLNNKMIDSIVAYKNKQLMSELDKKHYTTLVDLGYMQLLEYIDGNFNYYIENIVLKKQMQEDRNEVIIDMLSKLLQDQNMCIELIKHENFLIDNINVVLKDRIKNNKEVIKGIWNTILMNEKVVVNWENICSYWQNFSMSENLLNYIAKHIDKLKSANVECCDDEFIRSFIMAGCEINIYEQLLPILRMSNFDIELEDLDNERLEVMVNIGYFEFSTERYQYLFTANNNLAIKYIAKNQERFLEQIDEIEMSSSLLEKLLNEKTISDLTMKKLISLFGEQYMSKKNAEYVALRNIQVTKSCFDIIWEYLEDENQRILLLINNIELFDADNLQHYFSNLNGEYQQLADRSSRHEVDLIRSSNNLSLVEYLKKIEYITSYNIIDKYDHKVIKCRIKRVQKK